MKPVNADCREDAATVAERLYYEGVVQELGRDCDLLYVCPSNSALAHLPYLVALDNATRCAPRVYTRLNTRPSSFGDVQHRLLLPSALLSMTGTF